MGEYKLVPDPNANNPALVHTWIDQFNAEAIASVDMVTIVS